MNWFEQVNAYCERSGPQYWSEPVNAVTNFAFLIAAIIMWRRLKGPEMATGRVLAAVLFIIGIGSWLFHTHANRLTGMMDVLPILIFILIYVFVATRDYFGAPLWLAGLITAGFIPYSAATVPLFSAIPGIGSSASYAPVPLLILIYALLLRPRLPETARGLAAGAGILIVSLIFRTLDQPLCGAIPLGTHFMWHILNAVMLGWMIEVWRRWRLSAR
ncbi:MAG: ceramidase domain-containing protein [Paracoccus sp. (in: a-proteobacteria)]|nr:ceramidase domain-containing protein [Paracoccus sp. (in: a-proteobacteria)]